MHHVLSVLPAEAAVSPVAHAGSANDRLVVADVRLAETGDDALPACIAAANAFIDHGRRCSGGVLVHGPADDSCAAAVVMGPWTKQRARWRGYGPDTCARERGGGRGGARACRIAAYVMWRFGYAVADALRLVQRARPAARPHRVYVCGLSVVIAHGGHHRRDPTDDRCGREEGGRGGGLPLAPNPAGTAFCSNWRSTSGRRAHGALPPSAVARCPANARVYRLPAPSPGASLCASTTAYVHARSWLSLGSWQHTGDTGVHDGGDRKTGLQRQRGNGKGRGGGREGRPHGQRLGLQEPMRRTRTAAVHTPQMAGLRSRTCGGKKWSGW